MSTHRILCDAPLDWHGLYRGGWDLGVEESVAHPAKMSPLLCGRILVHLRELGLLAPGDTVLDPMGGTGTTAMAALEAGYRAVTVELESRFVGFQRQNKALWKRRLGRPVDWTILQGDARRVDELLAGHVRAAVTSPPYGDMVANEGNGVDWGKANRPDRLLPSEARNNPMTTGEWRYGTTPGNIGNLRVVTSPPYAGDVSDSPSDPHPERMQGGQAGYRGQYGDTPGQIGALKAVTSPPYEGMDIAGANYSGSVGGRYREHGGTGDIKDILGISEGYGTASGQIETDDDYWSSMHQVYAALSRVADVCAVVTKDPTRNKQLYPLGDLTAKALEATGWRIVCRHHAILFTETEQAGLLGEVKRAPKGRLSFFKRLSYEKGSPVAQWEDVLVAVRRTP